MKFKKNKTGPKVAKNATSTPLKSKKKFCFYLFLLDFNF